MAVCQESFTLNVFYREPYSTFNMKLLDPLISCLETTDEATPWEPMLLLNYSASMRTYFRTQDGSHGLCYPTYQAGDQVWVLHGASALFVLRSVYVDMDVEASVLRPPEAYTTDKTGAIIGVEKNFEARVAHYQLIGDCYYDGFMDGDGLDDGKFPSQSILLV
jgi:hypothetical protein